MNRPEGTFKTPVSLALPERSSAPRWSHFGVFPLSTCLLWSCLQAPGRRSGLPRESQTSPVHDGRGGSSGRRCCPDKSGRTVVHGTPREACCIDLCQLGRGFTDRLPGRLGEPLPRQLTLQVKTSLSCPSLYRIASIQGLSVVGAVAGTSTRGGRVFYVWPWLLPSPSSLKSTSVAHGPENAASISPSQDQLVCDMH